MTVLECIQFIELGLTGRGVSTRPNPETIRDIIRAKWNEFVGEAEVLDGKYELTTVASTTEYELPESVRRVNSVIVDNSVAYKTTPEARDRTYAEDQASA